MLKSTNMIFWTDDENKINNSQPSPSAQHISGEFCPVLETYQYTLYTFWSTFHTRYLKEHYNCSTALSQDWTEEEGREDDEKGGDKGKWEMHLGWKRSLNLEVVSLILTAQCLILILHHLPLETTFATNGNL